jgi:hypothetical protein
LENLDFIIHKMNELVPPAATLLWLPQSSCWAFEESLASKRNRLMNRAPFDRLKSRFFNTKDKWLPFYDTWALTCALRSYSRDWVHLAHQYYEAIMDHALALLCTS